MRYKIRILGGEDRLVNISVLSPPVHYVQPSLYYTVSYILALLLCMAAL